MNLVDAVVVEVLGTSYEAHGKIWRNAKVNAWGNVSEIPLMFSTWEAADNVKVGDWTLV